MSSDLGFSLCIGYGYTIPLSVRQTSTSRKTHRARFHDLPDVRLMIENKVRFQASQIMQGSLDEATSHRFQPTTRIGVTKDT